MSDAFQKGVEAAARAIADYNDKSADDDWELANLTIRAFLAAAEANGWRCVPAKMNEAMKAEAHRLNHPRDHEIYEAGVAAAPRIEGEG